MEIITENWVFQNVMPWVGIWFSAMTIIFLLVVIYGIFRQRLFSYFDVTGYAFDEASIIVFLIPMLMVAGIALIVTFEAFLAKK